MRDWLKVLLVAVLTATVLSLWTVATYRIGYSMGHIQTNLESIEDNLNHIEKTLKDAQNQK